ncbi:MAG TPA: hypothetical protein VFH87_10975, partial [Candidatus Udaeobacter sp.]|nr:hypothetical protein [Candidatus Udaeobacter sp.]
FRLNAWLSTRRGKFYESVAAVRSTGLRLLHFSNPEGFRGYQPCRYLRYNYRIVMISKINFLRGFCYTSLDDASFIITPL